jgi:hypothetical protein
MAGDGEEKLPCGPVKSDIPRIHKRLFLGYNHPKAQSRHFGFPIWIKEIIPIAA